MLAWFLTSASRYQSRSSMYIRGLIPRNSTELADADPIGRSFFLVLSMAFLIRAQSIFSITSTPSIVQLRRLVDQRLGRLYLKTCAVWQHATSIVPLAVIGVLLSQWDDLLRFIFRGDWKLLDNYDHWILNGEKINIPNCILFLTEI